MQALTEVIKKPKMYKIIKIILEDEVYIANIAPPDCEKIVEYYPNLWSDPNNEIEAANHEEKKYEPFSGEELDGALKNSRNGKAPGRVINYQQIYSRLLQ